MNREKILLDYIESKGNSTSEYFILKHIQDHHPTFFQIQQTPLSFYQKHFFLFHELYKLRRGLRELGRTVSITALEIRIVEIQKDSKEMAEPDGLNTFYLDQNNLNIPEKEVENMLRNFWLRYSALDQKGKALTVLGLNDFVDLDLKAIKNRFNKLALEKHPDRGGKPSEFREIKQAYHQLKKIYS